MAVLARFRLAFGILFTILIGGSLSFAQSTSDELRATFEPQSAESRELSLERSQRPVFITPPGGIFGFRQGGGPDTVALSTIAHVRGGRMNHLMGVGLVTGLQGTGDTIETLFSTQFELNLLKNFGVNLPSILNPELEVQTRDVATVVVTAELPPFARVGSRIDVLVSAMGDARSLQGGTLILTPLQGADRKVYALAAGPVSIEGYFAGAPAGASVRKNFQTVGQIPGGATVEREVPNEFSQRRTVELDLDTPDPAMAMRAARAIGAAFRDAQVRVEDPGALAIELPPWMTPTQFAAALENIRVETTESDKVVIDERTGTVVVGGMVTVGEAAISHGNLTVVIKPELRVSQPGAFSPGRTVAMRTAQIQVSEDQGQFFMMPRQASVAQIAETLNAVGTKPGDVIAIFEALNAAGALHGRLIIR